MKYLTILEEQKRKRNNNKHVNFKPENIKIKAY